MEWRSSAAIAVALFLCAVPNTLGDGNQIEETRRVLDGVRRKAGMQVLKDFAVSAPATESQVAGADKQVTFFRSRRTEIFG